MMGALQDQTVEALEKITTALRLASEASYLLGFEDGITVAETMLHWLQIHDADWLDKVEERSIIKIDEARIIAKMRTSG